MGTGEEEREVWTMRREGSMENEKRGKYGKWEEEREVWKMRREGSMENEKKRGKYEKWKEKEERSGLEIIESINSKR